MFMNGQPSLEPTQKAQTEAPSSLGFFSTGYNAPFISPELIPLTTSNNQYPGPSLLGGVPNRQL